jgi:chromatin modification-related protein EAF6
MTEPVPSTEDRSRYEAIKKELVSALPKKRAIDKQLVRKHASPYRATLNSS